jgi:RNA polymerase sigma-70 factor (ECF subfamily)
MIATSPAIAHPLERREDAIERADRPAFETLVTAHRAALYGRARKLCRGHVDADDLLQDVLERAWRNYGRMREGDHARAWLFQILNNAFIDRVRAQNSAPRTTQVDDLPLAQPEPDAAAPAWQELSARDLLDAVAELPADVRDIYKAHALDGRDYLSIAKETGLPKNTVGTRLLRARRLLRELLDRRLGKEARHG